MSPMCATTLARSQWSCIPMTAKSWNAPSAAPLSRRSSFTVWSLMSSDQQRSQYLQDCAWPHARSLPCAGRYGDLCLSPPTGTTDLPFHGGLHLFDQCRHPAPTSSSCMFSLLSSWNRSPRSILWISTLSESILGVPRLPNSYKIFSLKISDLSCCISEKPRKCQIPTDCVRRPWYECSSEPDSHRRSSTTGISVMEVS